MKISNLEKNQANLLTPNQFESFLQAIPKITELETNKKITKPYWPISPEEFQMLYKMTYYCALGIIEALNLVASDIDLKNKTVTIRQSVGVYEQTSIPPIIVDEIEQYLRTHKKKLFSVSRSTSWQYADAAGKIAGLNFHEEKKAVSIRRASLLLFKKSWERRMRKDDATEKMIAIKMRNKSLLSKKWPNYQINELIEWEERTYPAKKKGIIILLDALGIKGIWKSSSPTTVQRNWNIVIAKCNSLFIDLKSSDISPTFNAFSDTIIITTTGSDMKNLLTKTAEALIHTMGFAIKHDIFFRGCISIGEFFPDPNIVIGKAIDDAAQYYEMPEWIGISITPNTHKSINSINFSTEERKKLFVSYDIPLKNTVEKNGLALNWPIHVGNIEEKTDDSAEGQNQTLIELVEKKIENSDEITVSFKWRNTLNFIKTVISD